MFVYYQIALWIGLYWISIGCDSAHLCENPNDSILGMSLSQGILLDLLSSLGEETIHVEFDATIRVLTLEFNKRYKFSDSMHNMTIVYNMKIIYNRIAFRKGDNYIKGSG